MLKVIETITNVRQTDLVLSLNLTLSLSLSLSLSLRSPFIYDLDIVGLGKAFHSIGMPVHSLACALLLPEEQLQNYIKVK